jgi:hypothetical protein
MLGTSAFSARTEFPVTAPSRRQALCVSDMARWVPLYRGSSELSTSEIEV